MQTDPVIETERLILGPFRTDDVAALFAYRGDPDVARYQGGAARQRGRGRWGYRRLIGSVDPRNTGSVALCRALGMRQEAHHVESHRFRGEWVDD